MTDLLTSFLDQYFEGIILEPALFYSWENSIRFEIADPEASYRDSTFMIQAFHRARRLFDEVFGEGDEILMITEIEAKESNSFLHKRPLNVYRKYIKTEETLYKMKLQTLHDIEMEEGEEERVTHRFSLQCKKTDIRYPQLLHAICYEDYGHPSTILKKMKAGYEIYFINLSKGIIHHLYDDRGCDILAAEKEGIRFLYEQYNLWILDFDRDEIDGLFKR